MQKAVVIIDAWHESYVAKQAKKFAHTHGLDVRAKAAHDADGMAVVFEETGVSLQIIEGKKPLRVSADFISGGLAHRRQFGGGKGQSIAKAVGIKGGFRPQVLDLTAGLGRDAFVLACLGVEVNMLERSPFVQLLLNSGLAAAKEHAENSGDQDLVDILQRMHLIERDAGDYLRELNHHAEVIYLDPMFPERRKSALVKKDMRVFHAFVGADDDSDALLAIAREKALYRVVVKRSKNAEFLAGEKPSFQLPGKSSRFDIYTNKAFPVT